MDRPSTEEARLQELIRLSQSSRAAIGYDVQGLRRTLDLPMRLKDSLHQKPSLWLAGSAVAGIATSFLLRRKSRRKDKSPKHTNPLLGLTLTAARPLVKVWLGNKLSHWAAAAMSRQAQASQATPFKQNPDTSLSNVNPPGPRPR